MSPLVTKHVIRTHVRQRGAGLPRIAAQMIPQEHQGLAVRCGPRRVDGTGVALSIRQVDLFPIKANLE
jgi:hypothetical protein